MTTEFETEFRSSSRSCPAPGTAGTSAGPTARTYDTPAGAADATRPGHDPKQAAKERAGAIWDDARETARSKLNEQKDVAAGGLGEVAGALREAAQRQRTDGSGQSMAQLTSSAADGLEHLSHTLRSKDVSTMLRDVDHFARNQPVAFFGIALAAGFLAVRFLKADNEDVRR